MHNYFKSETPEAPLSRHWDAVCAIPYQREVQQS